LEIFRKLFGARRPDPGISTSTENESAFHLHANVCNAGIELVVDPLSSTQPRLVPDSSVSQTTPKDCYVYAHVDRRGAIFYIGRGSGRCAWSRDRDRLWHRYVDTHLDGKYTVQILADALSPSDAEPLEGGWMDQENEGLINLQNMARRIDLDALRRRDELMARNKMLIAEAKPLERTNLDRAIELYVEALALLKQFAGIPIETGLYARILAEDVAANGPMGQISLLDRLTICLVRAGRVDEARRSAAEYFSGFKRDRSLPAAARIEKRVARDKSL
jgi:hypothetical protein